MRLTVKELLEMVEKLNIPEDAEIWIEYPARYGVLKSVDENNPTFETFHSEGLNEESDWISTSSLGWSKSANRLRIYHHF